MGILDFIFCLYIASVLIGLILLEIINGCLESPDYPKVDDEITPSEKLNITIFSILIAPLIAGRLVLICFMGLLFMSSHKCDYRSAIRFILRDDL